VSRANNAMIWSMPQVFSELMRLGALEIDGGMNAIHHWLITLYDRLTHGFIRNVARTNRTSLTEGLRANRDGWVDLFFGPQPPRGYSANWTPTDPAQRFEVLARFYGLQPVLFDRSRVLPDVERIGCMFI
jgi:hypothetical protein